jgi:hypothetical protein
MTFSSNILDIEQKVFNQLPQAMKIHSLNIHKPDSALLIAHGQVHGMQSIKYNDYHCLKLTLIALY